MPYTITWMPDGVLIRLSGEITFEENMKFNGEIYGDARFESLRYEIGDFREVTKFHVSEKETTVIANLERHSARWNSRMKVAHITSDPYMISLIRQYEESMTDTAWDFGLFETMEEAEAWVMQD
jgi:hypothetical protein